MRAAPNFDWAEATNVTVSTIENAVVFNTTTGFYFMYGRINLTSSAGVEYTQVSKVHVNQHFIGFYYKDEQNVTIVATQDFEVLTCDPTVE
jgi:hypothetical protein